MENGICLDDDWTVKTVKDLLDFFVNKASHLELTELKNELISVKPVQEVLEAFLEPLCSIDLYNNNNVSFVEMIYLRLNAYFLLFCFKRMAKMKKIKI